MQTGRPKPSLRLVLLGLFVSAQLVAQSSQVQSALQRGAQAMHNGQPAIAEQAFRDAVHLAPTMAEAHLDLGLVLGREGKLDEAVASLRQALALDPNAANAHMFLGIFLYQTNHPDEARRELQAELAVAPDSVEALTWLGRIDLAQGHAERATVSFDRASELAPNDLDILQFRGLAHNQVAKDSYARMARLDPNSWHVHNIQAQLYADEGKHAEAIVEYQAALKQQPNDPDLYEGLGDEYRHLSQLEAAEAAYQKGLDLAPANPVALYNLGSVKIDRGDNAGGVPLLLAMQKVYPDSPLAEFYLGRGLSSLGKDEEAVTWLQKSAAAQGTGEIQKRSLYELTRVYRKLHRVEEAQAALVQYNRLRLASDKQGAAQVQEWKKLGAPNAPAQAISPPQ